MAQSTPTNNLGDIADNVVFHYHMDGEGNWRETNSFKRNDCQYKFLRVIKFKEKFYPMIIEIRPKKFGSHQVYLITEHD